MISLSIISADAKRTEVAEYQFAQKVKKDNYESARPQRIERLAECIFNDVKKAINKIEGGCFARTYIEDYEWYVADRCEALDFPSTRCDWNEYREALEIAEYLLNCAGYKTSHYEYSKSWHTRSGRLFEVSVNWE
jgi:hypothetical protein